MSECPAESLTSSSCARCARQLTGERPLRLPDGRDYCAACCDRMATEQFELETGETFAAWIEKHPRLVMEHAPMEIGLRRLLFVAPLLAACGSLMLLALGFYRLVFAGKTGLGFMLLGGLGALAFAAFSLRQLRSFLRARGFVLTLEAGRFELKHGPRRDAFNIEDVEQACVVRPGTVGAREGALGLKDGRMLTLDTCLTDLHALGVVMDLRFREDFPPSLEDQWKDRRDKLRKIRGLE
ncbi:MAG: hypothetical protein M5U26_21375 [Planctomycetota bacterium]|nr:hypothetical protein [Planctomycetota bacterium]